MAEICPAGRVAFPDAVAPCPGLVVREGKALCRLVLVEQAAGMEPLIALNLGIGYGCSMVDDDTPAALQFQFDEQSRLRAAKDWTALRDSRLAKLTA